jgi:hypothetical protein
MALLFMSSFGMLHMGMNMGPDGTMSDCPFAPGGSSICTMTPLEHIGAIQSLFTTLPQRDNALSLFLLLISGIFAVVFFWQSASPPKLLYKRRSIFERGYIPLHGFLQEAFSNGILNSKVF